MKVEILEKMENPLLGRTELKFKVDHTGAPTPRRLDVRSQLSAILGVGEDLVVIEKITSSHGRQVASGIARVYGSKERLEKIEPKYLLRRVPSKGEQTEKSSEEQKTEKLEPTKEGEAKPESKGAESKKEDKRSEEQKPDEKKQKEDKT